MPEARAAGWSGKLDELGQRLFGRGKDAAGKKLVQKLCKPNAKGQWHPFTTPRAVDLVRYNIVDVLLLAQIHGVVSNHVETDVLAVDRVINARGVAFDAEPC